MRIKIIYTFTAVGLTTAVQSYFSIKQYPTLTGGPLLALAAMSLAFVVSIGEICRRVGAYQKNKTARRTLPKKQNQSSDTPSLMLLTIGSTLLFVQSPSLRGEDAVYFCRANKLAAPEGDRIDLSVLTLSTLPAVSWEVSDGDIESTSQNVVWTLRSIPVDADTVVATAVRSNDHSPLCSVEVRVISSPTMGNAAETGTAYLIHGVAPSRSAAYSYLLFAHPPQQGELTRTRLIITAYLAPLRSVHDLQKSFAISQINQFLLPIDSRPPRNEVIDSARLGSEKVDWAVEHLDIDFSKALLAHLSGTFTKGPYIVSCLHSIDEQANDDSCGVQDLSVVPDNLIASWMADVEFQAAQRQYWQNGTLTNFSLRLRTLLEVMGVNLPDALKAVAQVTKWK